MKFPKIGERQWVTMGLFFLVVLLLMMALYDTRLWGIDAFKTIIQAVVLTGLLNMVLAFHFAANKGIESSRDNAGKAFDAIKATADAGNNNIPKTVVVANPPTAPVPIIATDDIPTDPRPGDTEL